MDMDMEKNFGRHMHMPFSCFCATLFQTATVQFIFKFPVSVLYMTVMLSQLLVMTLLRFLGQLKFGMYLECVYEFEKFTFGLKLRSVTRSYNYTGHLKLE